MKERLLAAYFTEGQPIGDRAVLTELAVGVGLDPTEVESTLLGRKFAEEVRGDESRAASMGVSGVPFFVIDEAIGVSGAQPADVLLGAIERAWSESHPVTLAGAPDQGGSEAPADGTSAL
jgi:predicted DsbA family dithiol-disulfide isomerase